MQNKKLLELALGLESPWKIKEVGFNNEQRRIDIYLDFKTGSRFACSQCQSMSTIHDTVQKEWRHLNFFQHECYLHARTPRTSCDDCGVRVVEVPWARSRTGFTLLFEALILTLCQSMPVNTVSRLIGETDQRIWRMIEHHVEEARQRLDLDDVTSVGMDETAVRKKHDYVSLFVDMDQRRVIGVEEGKGSDTVDNFANSLGKHGGTSAAITQVCCDMSPAFISGVTDHFPKANITFDRYHVMKILNQAVDEVRKREVRHQVLLHKTKYLWLKNRKNLSAQQSQQLKEILSLKHLNLQTVRAYHIRENFKLFYTKHLSRRQSEKFLKSWFWWATHSRIKEMRDAAWTMKRHWDGVLNWQQSRTSNGLLEGLNSLFQATKAKARGYRSFRKIRTIIYLLLGRLNFKLPEPLPT